MLNILMVLFFVFLAVVLTMQWRMRSQARQQIGIDVPAAVRETAGQGKLVYFMHAAHCGPCKAIRPLVEKVAINAANMILVDVGQQPELAAAFQVRGTPTFIALDQGKVVDVKLGAVTERWLREHLAS